MAASHETTAWQFLMRTADAIGGLLGPFRRFFRPKGRASGNGASAIGSPVEKVVSTGSGNSMDVYGHK